MRRIAALACAALAACAQPAPQGEDPSEPPPYPATAGLIEFLVSPPGDFRFFVDGATLSVAKDGVVRYVLVARSPNGVDNVSYEALRCPSAEYRVYAVARPDGSWAGRRGEWRQIPPGQGWHVALYREYFCAQQEPIRDAAEGLRALRDGGHPFYKGFGR